MRFMGLLPCQVVQNLGGIGIGLDLRHDFLDVALFVNDKGGAYHAHTYLTVEFLFLPDAVGLNSLQFRIGQ